MGVIIGADTLISFIGTSLAFPFSSSLINSKISPLVQSVKNMLDSCDLPM